MKFDGTNLQVFTNGRKEYATTMGAGFVQLNFSSPTKNLTAGAATGSSTYSYYWKGALAALHLYSTTSTSSSPGSATTVKSNFDATANRFRDYSAGNIVTSGLVRRYDAANASGGIASPSAGCGLLSWFDLSSSNIDGVLNNYTSCTGTEGWYSNGNVNWEVTMN